MADEKNEKTSEQGPTTPTASGPTPPAPNQKPRGAASNATTPTASGPILEQGTAPDNVPKLQRREAAAGRYRVVHGSILFGNGVIAYPGALVQLGAEDAGLMLESGAVEPE